METLTNSKVTGTQQMNMPTSRPRWMWIAPIAAAGLAIAWYLFRPELLFIDKSVNEAFPTAGASDSMGASLGQPQAEGSFHSAAHETKGVATIYQLPSGKRVLRLTGFETSNGPDVHVFLGKAADATDNETVKNAGYLDLGSLKGNIGDQNYDVPTDVDLSDYSSVTIWCNRFSVNFGTAPLNRAARESMMDDAAEALSMGPFHAVAHDTKGTATIHRLASGQHVLRLTDFETSKGPDVHVFLGKAVDASDDATVKDAGYVDLGSLKGNVGDQNYEIPADVDPSAYKSVTIWCNRFNVNFGTAPLRMN